MADLSDIENSLVALIATSLFPTITYLPGDYQPSAANAVPLPTVSVPSPTIGPITAKLYRGWPESAMLTADVLLSRAHVSIFSESGMTRNVSRWFPDPEQVATVTPTITATVSGVTVTLGGTITAGNVVGVQTGAPVAAYAYMAQAGDTLATAATALAAKVPGATASGAVITLVTPLNIHAAVMVPQPVLTVTRQQEQCIRVSVWAPTPQARDALASLIDGSISGMKSASGFLTRFFAVGAYEAARIVARTTYTNDMPARDRIWRRDLCYTVEYPTTLLEQDPQALFVGGTATIGPTGTTHQISVVIGAAPVANGILGSDGSQLLGADGAPITSS